MASENNLETKKLNLDKNKYLNTKKLKKQTMRDQQNSNSNDTIKNTIIAGLAVAGGYGLYKSGMLKPIIGSLNETASKFAQNEYKTLKTIKAWANEKRDDIIEEIIEEGGKKTTIKRNNLSLFNPTKKTSLPNALWETLQESFNKEEIYTDTFKNIIKDTVEDIKVLNSRIQKELDGITKEEKDKIIETVNKELSGKPKAEIDEEIKKRVNNTVAEAKKKSANISDIDLMKNIREYKDTMNILRFQGMEQNEMFATKVMMKDFLDYSVLSDEIAEKQLKETGYRNLVLGDIFESIDFENNTFKFKEGVTPEKLLKDYNIDILSLSRPKEGDKAAKTIVDEISDFLVDPRSMLIDEATGTKKIIGSDENIWKRLIFDSSIGINDEGNIVNYKMSKNAFSFFANSLRYDFGLPVIGFNPLNTFMKFTPADKMLREKNMHFGVIKGVNGFSPFISGYGTRNADDISTAINKKIGASETETFNILFSNNKIYAMGSEGTNGLIGEGFNLYKAGKDSLPPEIENLRVMGGYDLKKDIKIMDTVLGDLKTVKPFDPNMSVDEYEKINGLKLNNFQKLKYEFGRRLELGYQEIRPNDTQKEMVEDITEAFNVDKFSDSIMESVTQSEFFKTNGFQYEDLEQAREVILNKYHEAFGESFEDIMIGDRKFKFKSFVLNKQGIGFSDLINDVSNKDKEKFMDDSYKMFRQYFAGFDKDYKMSPFYNEKSANLFNVFNVLDSGLASIGLGLDISSKRSTGQLVKNLLLKRALPVFMLTQIPGMINYYSEPIFTNKKERKSGEKDNLGKTLMRDVVKPIDIGLHKIGDFTGFTSMMKYLQKMTPGYEHINELPGIYQLGLGQSAEERKEYIEKGYDPIRKNRYWSVSNTPFTGSKINYWRPNIYRRIEADTKYTSTKYGSRGEYYSNTWYPNLVNPLAPINHFILDPHHWDKKHYYDRPYAETAAKGENIPLIGPLVSGTVGQLYRRKMHKEYWNSDGTLKPVNVQDEKPNEMITSGSNINITPTKNNIFETIRRAWIDTESFNKITTSVQEQYKKAENRSLLDLLFARKILYSYSENRRIMNKFIGTPMYDNATNKHITAYQPGSTVDNGLYAGNITADQALNINNRMDSETFKNLLYTRAKEYSSPLQSSTLPYRDYNRYDTALDVYTTSSGSINIVDVPENLNLYKVNEEIKHYSLNKIYGTNQRVDINEYNLGYQEKESERPNQDTLWNLGEQVNDLYNIYGLRGFFIKTFATGEANIGATKVESSSYTYSANRSFWDQNLGGFGGELSEIARRFIHKKDNNTEWLNPIRNTMPTWMPGSNYFTDFLHGDPYSKITNGEERLPGEAYEKLNNIKFSFNISASMLGSSRSAHVRHFLHQDTNLTYKDEKNISEDMRSEKKSEILNDEYMLQNLNPVEELFSRFKNIFTKESSVLGVKYKFTNKDFDITGVVDAIIKDYHSPTGQSFINIRGVEGDEFNRLKSGHNIRNQDYYEMNFDMYSLKNTKGRGYIYYYNKDNPDEDIYKARVKFNMKDLKSSIQNLTDAKTDIYKGLKERIISRGDLYSLVDKYKILADTAPYSQEFKDISSQISHANLSAEQKAEVKAARERMEEQKKPIRTYDYKFKTSNLKSEKVTVKDIIDNNTILVNEYGHDHAIKFAGIRVSESNSTLYKPTVKEKKKKNKKTGRMVTQRTGKTMNDAAYDEIRRYLKPGQRITISYDADEKNKYNKDSTESIKAVITSKGTNVNRALLNKGLAKEKENDNSPAGIHARYSKGDIAFGSLMENITHKIADIPIIGDKFLQVRSPYEQYRKREVYDKDFKTWNHPIRDYLIPAIQDTGQRHPLFAITTGAYIGSLFGRPAFAGATGGYGKLLGTVVGGMIGAAASGVHILGSNKEHEYRPKRRRQQEELNTYMDTLKYVKNTRLFNKYKELAKKENNFDVDEYIKKHKEEGDKNKERVNELNRYKKLVKLDFKHRGNYNFKYGRPIYEEKGQDKKATIRAINRELADIGNDRKVEKLPLNAIKALAYRDEAQKTVYAFQPGDDIRNIMSALPKKERQYYSELVKAPEEEKQKILRIAPSYLRKALQSSWGMKVDEQPTLTEYFKSHALPDENWAGWSEDTNLDNVKVKIVNANGMDPGEFDIWNNNKKEADKVNIPIPRIHTNNNERAVESQLQRLMNSSGFDDIQILRTSGISGNKTNFYIKEDSRNEVAGQIKNLDYDY